MTCIAGAMLGPSVTCIAEVVAPAAATVPNPVVPLLLLLMAAVYVADLKGESKNEISSSSIPPQKFP